MTDVGLLHGHSLLAVVAHPDDESLACGGLLALCARRGARSAVLCLTRGEHGGRGDRVSPDARATARTAELHAAAAALGLTDLVVLDYEDGGLPWLDASAIERDIEHVIDRIAPDVVVTFDEDGLYRHPDHVAVHERTTAAVSAREGRAPALYYVTMPPGSMRALVDGVAKRAGDDRTGAHVLGIEDPDAFGAAAPPPTHIVDVRAFARRKLEALRCHATQIGDGALALVTPEDAPLWLGLEHYRRAAIGSDDPSFLDLLPETAIVGGILMQAEVLRLLRCPFCGTPLDLVENEALAQESGEVTSGVLGCQCCAFPIVAGIPVMLADDRTREAMHALEAGHRDAALLTLLGLDDGTRRQAFTALLGRTAAVTYRDAQDILSPDAEGTYFVYRFSDPTYLMSSSVLRAIATGCRPARVIDVCGGSGHLTRDLIAAAPGALVALADVFYWKLWLAKTFTAPASQPVCCDGNAPLPFSRDAFEMAVLSDAFPYIWHKRLLAEELMRVAGSNGVVVMPHLHSSLGFNYSAGMTLTPAAYADLFAPMHPRLFSDRNLTDGVLDQRVADLSSPLTPDEVGDEPSLTLVATRRAEVYRRHDLVESDAVSGQLIVNPLYRVERRNGLSVLTLAFPTPEYEEEFGGCRRYLPDTVTLAADLTRPIDATSIGVEYAELRRRRVLLDAPLRFC